MSLRFLLFLVASGLFDTVLVAAALLCPTRGGRGPVGLLHVGLALGALGAAFVAKTALAFVLGAGAFGVIHLAYLDLFIVLPLVGLGLLILERRAKERFATRAVHALATASLAIACVGFYASWIEPYRLELERVRVPIAAEREGEGTVTIGILSDLQTTAIGAHERRAVDWLVAAKPDLIVIPGDLYQGPFEGFDAVHADFRDLVSRLEAPGGVYFVPGDVDHPLLYEPLFAGTSVRILTDSIVETEVGDRRVTLAGSRLNPHHPDAVRIARELEERPGEGDLRLLLTHRPDAVYNLVRGTRVDLVLAGHTHGGQVRLPFFGPPITLTHVPRAVAAGGLHELEGRRLYISRGVGMERGPAPRLRFLCPPEVSLLELTAPLD